MKIVVLYFEDCPSWRIGVENLYAALERAGLEWSVDLVEIQDNEDAQRCHFLGSPSFQINGVDLWPQNRQDYAMSCRVYPTPEGFRGWPTVEMFSERLGTLTGRTP